MPEYRSPNSDKGYSRNSNASKQDGRDYTPKPSGSLITGKPSTATTNFFSSVNRGSNFNTGGLRDNSPKTKSGVVIAPKRGYARKQTNLWDSLWDGLGRGFAGDGSTLSKTRNALSWGMPVFGPAINAGLNYWDTTNDDDMTQSGWKYQKKPKPTGQTTTSTPAQRDWSGGKAYQGGSSTPDLLKPVAPKTPLASTGMTPEQQEAANVQQLLIQYPIFNSLRTGAYDMGTYRRLQASMKRIRAKQRPGTSAALGV